MPDIAMAELLLASKLTPYPLGLCGYDERGRKVPHCSDIAVTSPRSRQELMEEAPALIVAWKYAERDEDIDQLGEALADFADEWQCRGIIDACQKHFAPEPIRPISHLRYWCSIILGLSVVAVVFVVMCWICFGGRP